MADDSNYDEAEAARAEAEARRRRILEASGERIGLVTGEVDSSVEERAKPSGGAARMQAMRRRRFKKKQQDATAGDAAEETTTEKTKEEKIVVEEPKGSTTTAATEEAPSTATTDSSSRKYVGVAKMRRKLLAEKKQQQQQETTTTKQTVVTAAPSPAPIASPLGSTVPIWMQLFTAVLLFLAGLDIGLQQQEEEPAVVLHRELAFRQQGGGPLGRLLQQQPKIHKAVLLGSEKENTRMPEFAAEEEFSDSPPKGVSSSIIEEEPNIDPIFQVDLDALTEGPGLLLFLARGAVAVHRAMLAVFLYLPLRMIKTIWKLPQLLWTFPPVFFLTSTFLRFVGRTILGAHLPEPSPQKDEKDVLLLLRNSAVNMVSNSFPKMAMLYTIFKDVRSDMYVMLCGFFLGLAWPYYSLATAMGGDDKEEL